MTYLGRIAALMAEVDRMQGRSMVPLTSPLGGCRPCTDYLARRANVLAPHIHQAAIDNDTTDLLELAAYMRGVHARHLSGGTL
jgi:hypothetical protein